MRTGMPFSPTPGEVADQIYEDGHGVSGSLKRNGANLLQRRCRCGFNMANPSLRKLQRTGNVAAAAVCAAITNLNGASPIREGPVFLYSFYRPQGADLELDGL